ncbi:MAG: proprotein convertase P-domain-containing protein, partial [Microcoleaceae cyanobacterium]
DVTISAENIGELSGDIILFADNDITINENIETTESVELKAGRSININADIDTSIGNGNIDLLGNNDEMNIANRSAGVASINQLDGTILNAGSGRINIELGNLGEVGDINLANLTTTGEALVNANGGNITRVSDSSIINAGSALFQTFGSGGIGLIDAPLRLDVENLEAISGTGGVFFDVGNVNIGDVSEDVDGIVTAGGDIEIQSAGDVTLTETISTIETVENNSEVGATENTEVTDTGGAINIEATGDIVATGSGIKGGGESVSLSGTNITINDEFEETSGDADVKLEATNDITVEDIEDNVLEFLPGGGEIEFRADVDGDGIGVVEMLDNEADVGSDPNTFENGADTIKTNGRNLTIAGAGISLGNVDTSGLPIYSGGELVAAIDVDEGGAIPPELEDKSGLIPEEDVDFSDIEFDENFNYIIDGESYYFAEIEGKLYYVPIAQTLNDTATFTFTVDGDLANVQDLDVRFSAAHTYNSDLQVYLISPQGQEVILFAGVGFGQNFQDTLLDDDASTNIGSGIAPFNSTYIPQGSLADFNGENPNGIWTLRVTDISPQFSNGTLYRAGDAAPWGSATGTQLLLRNPTTLVSSGGNGGAINLEATQGDINVGNIRSLSESGNGGRVDLKANNNIITGLIHSSSSQGIGGDINLNAVSGNIDTFSLDTSSIDSDGGNIQIEAAADITTADIITDSGEFLVSEFLGTIDETKGDSSNAGKISIESTAGSIDTTAGTISALSVSGDGGHITLTAEGDIKTEEIVSYSVSLESNSGNGGDITLNAGSEINTASLNSSSFAEEGNSGDGGNIILNAGSNISSEGINSSSSATIGPSFIRGISVLDSEGNSGDGGNITLNAGSNIFSEEIISRSYANYGNSGNGGDITLNAGSDIFNNKGVVSHSNALEGNSGNGGNITMTAGSNITTKFSSFEIVGAGSTSIVNEDGSIIMIPGPLAFSVEGISSYSNANNGNSGNGGNITLSAGGNINTASLSSSQQGNSGNGGAISIEAGGDITTESFDSSSFSFYSDSGNGGAISIEAGGDITTESFNSFSLSFDSDSGNGGAISLNAHTIKFNPPQDEDTDKLEIITFSAGTNDSGNGGDVNITANNLSNAEILTLSSYSKSGDVIIESQPQGNLQLSDSSIITSKQVTIMLDDVTTITIDVGDTQGQSGDVNIFSSGNLSLNDITIESDTKGDQPAGDVNINSQKTITLDNTDILSITSAEGDAGNITLETPQDIQLTNNSQLRANTEGTGNAGRIDIEANKLNLEQGTSLITETYAAGAPGDITIEANTVDIGQDAQISATVVLGAPSTGDGGNITINTNELNITGKLGIFAETEASANAGTLILSPYKDNPDLNINFSNDGFISASTSSTGNGGNINIFAPESIDISGEGFIAVETSDEGNAGTINIETQNLTLSDGVAISASTTDKGNAGAINIDTQDFTLETGTSLTTETESAGKAGDITINSERLTIGKDAEISATAKEGATNTEAGGNITINANDVLISGLLGIFAETAGDSPAGTLQFTPYENNPNLNINFTEEGFISARTTSKGDGGNINIFAPENINISGEGRITVETEGSGNAGIINIETENLTIGENTTISAATSNSGDGGSINITPTQTFQLEGQIITETTGTGEGGNITINTGEMIAPNSTISAKSTDTGNAGTIEITAQENITTGIITSEANNTTETADGGNITITSEQGEINATQPIQSFSEQGNAGNVSLTAQNDITTNTISSHGQQQGGQIIITSETGNIDTSNSQFLANYSGEGDAGNVTIEAPQGNITTSDIYSFADADGGEITITSGGDINITDNSNIISASEPPTNNNTDNPGKGGDITLEAGNNINTTTARIYSGADVGDTGKIDIIADSAIETGQIDLASGFVRDRVTVNENFTLIPLPQGEATQGVAGNITLNSNNSTIDTTAGTINSRSPDGSGNITINARENITTGKLEASALNPNQPTTGGDVSITSTQAQINATQAIETFSERGTAGNVNIKAEGSVNIENILSQGTQRGGDISIDSRSQNSINAQGELNTYSTEGIAGDVNLTSPGSITINGIRSEGMEQGGTVTVESEIGNIDSTGGDIDSFSDQGIGGNVTLNAPESVNLSNVSSFGATESGDLRIQSRTAAVNTGNVTTEAPAGSSGSIIINGEEVGTGDLSSIGTTSAGEINVEATDGSINTYDIEISSDGTVGDLIIRASEDVTTGDINQNAGEGDANINIESEEDQNIGDINQIAENDTNNIQIADGDLTTGDVTQIAGNDTNNIQIADGNQNIGNVTQTAGNDTNNIQLAGGNQNIGNVTQTAGNDANNIQIAEGNQNIGNVTQIAGDDTNNIPIQEINQNTDNTSVIPDNNNSIINLSFNQENTQTNNNTNLLNNSQNNTTTNSVETSTSILSSTITPSNNDQTTNTATAKEQTEESINNTTDTQQILEVIDTVNTNPLTVATGSYQVLTMLEQNRINEYSDYFGEDFNEKLVNIENVRDILTDMASQTGKESAVVYINAYKDQIQVVLFTKDGQPIIKTISTANRDKLKLTTIKLIAEIANPEKRQTTSYLAAS